MAETNNTQSFKGSTSIFDRSNENYNAWIADKATNLNFTDWLNEKNVGRTNNVDTTLVNPSNANNEFGLLSPDTAPPYLDYQNFYKNFWKFSSTRSTHRISSPIISSTSISTSNTIIWTKILFLI